MKINNLLAGAILLFPIASAQSLFGEYANEDQTTPLPLKFTATAGIGYDDSFTSSSTSTPTSSAYVNAALGAEYVNFTPKTTWKIGAKISANKYLSGGNNSNGDMYYNGRFNISLNHRLSARTRYVQNTYANYGIEPNYSFSFTPNRTPSEHLFYSSDHALGYRWTPKFATYTGFRVSGVNYHGDSVDKTNNRRTYALYNTFRYSVGPNTVATARIEYAKTEASGSTGDSNDITGSVGFEHRVSDNGYVTAQIGATYRDVQGGRSNYISPYVSLAHNTHINSKLRVKTFARYGIENYGTSFGNTTFDTNQAVRIGAEANYQVSQKLSVNAGVNYIRYDYADGRDVATNTAVNDADQQLLNPYVGFSYMINDQTNLNGSYHFNKSSSSFNNASGRDYNRNRVQLGVSRTF